MTEVELKRLLGKAKYVAIRKGLREEEAEEFTQEVAIRGLKGNGVKMLWAVSDFLRDEHGDSRSACGRARQVARLRAIALDAPVKDQDSHSILNHELIGSSDNGAESFEGFVGFERSISNLKKSDRAILVLLYHWGFTYAEIGYCLGLTQSRICQRLKELQAGISKKIQNPQQREMANLSKTFFDERKRQSLSQKTVERVLPKKETTRPYLPFEAYLPMAEIKPREMALNYEACFDPRLTQEMV